MEERRAKSEDGKPPASLLPSISYLRCGSRCPDGRLIFPLPSPLFPLPHPCHPRNPWSIRLQSRADPDRVAAAIQHRSHVGLFRLNGIINGKREPLGKESVISEHLAVDAGIDFERVNVRKQGIQEVGAQPCLLTFIKRESVRQVLLGRRQNDDGHASRSRSSRLASSQL